MHLIHASEVSGCFGGPQSLTPILCVPVGVGALFAVCALLGLCQSSVAVGFPGYGGAPGSAVLWLEGWEQITPVRGLSLVPALWTHHHMLTAPPPHLR